MICRAWCIINKESINYLVKRFNHDDATVELAEWVLPVADSYIRNYAPYTETSLIVTLEELETFSIVYEW